MSLHAVATEPESEVKTPTPAAFTGLKRVKRPTAIRTITLGEMSVSPAAQREFREYKGREILDSFDESKIGIFTVSHRDGRYWIIDGQHRRWALSEFIGEGWEDWEIEVLCHFDLTERDEADLFLVLNNHLAVSALDAFKVAVTAERSTESDIDRIVRSLGLRVGGSIRENSITAVTALEKVYQAGGPRLLVRTLHVIREAWGGTGFEAAMIEGLAKFIARYDGRYNEDSLTKKLSKLTGGMKALGQQAYVIRERTGASKRESFAAAITEIYNKGLRGQASLGSWWKDGSL